MLGRLFARRRTGADGIAAAAPLPPVPPPAEAPLGGPRVSQTEALVRRLEWTVVRRLDGMLQGDYRTLFRGFGLDLADLREYRPGDDVRHIDWNVTARLQTPHVREFQEDREVAVWFLLDLSGSIDFGSGSVRKRDLLNDFTTVLALLLTRYGNRVGAVFYGGAGEIATSVIPARAGRRQLLHLLDRMQATPAASPGDTRLRDLLERARSVAKRRSVMFVVSDFISAPGWQASLAMLARRHEIVAVRLVDPLEVALPDLGLVVLQDAETGEQMFVDTHDPAFRKRFAAAAEAREAELRQGFARAGVECLTLSTYARLDLALLHFARQRRHRQGAASGAGGIMIDAMSRLPLFSFLWPEMLWLLGFVLVLGAGYVWLDARRRRAAVHYPALRSVGLTTTGGAGWRRHVSPGLALLALSALIFAIARPQAVLMLPSRIDTVMLVMDLSGSMRAQDVKPSRIRAAQQAAKVLLDAQPSGVKVGVVAMAATAAVAHAPSRNREDVASAIDRLKPQGGTALGNGLLIALTTLLPQATPDAALLMDDDIPPQKTADALGSDDDKRPGSYASGAIVLFSDGESNAGPAVVQAAQLAAAHGVRIYTVGVGTTDGVVLSVDGWSARVKLDEKVLKQVADVTGAEYFRLEDASQLKKVYRALSAKLAFDKRNQVEITAFFAALGALLAGCAGLLSLWWFGRVL